MTFSGFSNAPKKIVETLQAFQKIQETAKNAKQGKAVSGDTSDNMPVVPMQEYDPSVAAVDEPQVHYEEKTETHNDEKFVLINGKYYEYRADHIYMVNGVKTYFVDNKKIVTTTDVKRSLTSENSKDSQALKAYQEAVHKVNSGTAEAFTSPDQALKKLQELQGMTHARDKYLDTIRADGN